MGEDKMETASLAGTMILLTRLSRVVYRRATPELLGIRLKEFVALVYLRESTRATQQRLAQTLMLDANNCVILLNGLEENGLIERTRDPEDRRRHIVALALGGHRDDVAATVLGVPGALDQPVLLEAVEEDDAVVRVHHQRLGELLLGRPGALAQVG